jgi:hypothetical protein
MDLLILPLFFVLGVLLFNGREQRQRVAMLGAHLNRHQIEPLMQKLMQAYMRALGEADLARQAQIWHLQSGTELALCEQFNAFVLELANVNAQDTRGSRLAFALPYAVKLFPNVTFDLRKVLGVHARGLTQALAVDEQIPPKSRAFTVMAELLLMQHTCHWFCRSKTMASARLLAHHQTAYAQVLASVPANTRHAYLALMH